jgi:hypothetical protein
MSAGSLTMTCLLLLTGQAPADEVYFNQRAMKIPIDTPPGLRRQVKEFVLYVSADQGKNWERYGSELPDKDFFIFRTPKDGEYWFRIAAINSQGKQDPENLYAKPPQQKVKIDTVHKPSLRIVSAKRIDGELVVTWEAQSADIPPDPASMKLEYRMLDGSSTVWFPVLPLTPNTTGVAKTRLDGPGRVAVRMQFRDVAGNVAKVEGVEIPAAAGALTAAKSGPVIPPPPAPDAVRPVNHTPDALPSPSAGMTPPKVADPPSVAQTTSGQAGTPAPAGLPNPPTPVDMPRERAPGSFPTPSGPERETPVASTSQRPQVAAPPVPESAAGRPPRQARPAPVVQLVNTREVTLEYQLSKLGPSGVSSVILYVTADGGKTWAAFKDERPPDKTQPVVGNKYQRILTLPAGEGVYGLILGIRNGGDLGRPKPQPGETPEMLIEVDLTAPYAELSRPEPDPERSDAVLLKWCSRDKNLAEHPVTLEWAEQPQGNWQPIAADQPGTGSYSWKVPPGIPVQVYLRLRVRDRAGNEGVAVTSRPQIIDLVEPEGQLVGVRAVSRH